MSLLYFLRNLPFFFLFLLIGREVFLRLRDRYLVIDFFLFLRLLPLTRFLLDLSLLQDMFPCLLSVFMVAF